MDISNLSSDLSAGRLGAWAIYPEQIERVKPHLGNLGEHFLIWVNKRRETSGLNTNASWRKLECVPGLIHQHS